MFRLPDKCEKCHHYVEHGPTELRQLYLAFKQLAGKKITKKFRNRAWLRDNYPTACTKAQVVQITLTQQAVTDMMAIGSTKVELPVGALRETATDAESGVDVDSKVSAAEFHDAYVAGKPPSKRQKTNEKVDKDQVIVSF